MVQSVPTQVSLRVGELAPFWTHVGEMTSPETTPDFSAVLQAALATAKIENGFYDLAFTIHLDSIGRVKVELEVEALAQQEVLSAAVPEIALPFDVSTLAKSKASELTIEVPANSRVVPSATSARVKGAFEETRIAHGPTGQDNPVAAIEVSPAYSQAQVFVVGNQKSPSGTNQVSPIETNREIAALAVDLLLEALTPSAKLQLDIRGDFDGKPDEIPLLPAPVEFGIEQLSQKGPTWTSVVLPSEFLFAKTKDKPATYWLLLQSVEGRAAWSISELHSPVADASSEGRKESRLLDTQRTDDGGLSWKDGLPLSGSLRDKKAKPPFAAFFRLRDKPKSFKMPIQLQIGDGKNEVRKTLDRFEPLGRVEFTFDTELARGINDYLDKSEPSASPETEHLVNAGFERWQKVGEQMVSRTPALTYNVPINGVAFSPDGATAYVLDFFPEKNGFLLLVDVDCNQKIEDKKIALALKNAQAFVVNTDGTRAYVIDGRSVQIVNLETNEALGPAFQIIPPAESLAQSLTLSADGQRLYVASLSLSPPRRNRIRIVDTAKLEQQLAQNKTVTGVQVVKNVTPTDPLQPESAAAIALSPDEQLLYMLVDRTGGNSVVEVVELTDAPELSLSTPSIVVGAGATSMALTRDGQEAVVTNMDSGTISIIDTTARSAFPVTIPEITAGVKELPRLVAVSQDGAKGYVFNQGSRSIAVVDINRRVVTDRLSLNDLAAGGPLAESLALSPQGDQIYVANANSNTLSSIQIGNRSPSDWQLTSGETHPICFAPPFHLVAELGSPSLPTSLSQVVPVVESAVYEFSFWANAVEPETDEPPAVAEVLWLSSACGLLIADSVPIELAASPAGASFTTEPSAPKAPLIFHRKTTREVSGENQPLTSPAGATQAEVRFSVGKGAAARIDLVSLAVTSDVTANGDFKSQKDGQLADWSLVPEKVPGFNVVASENGIQLRNAGAITAELVQAAAAESGGTFTLGFQGHATAGPLKETARIELVWLKADGSAAGEKTVMNILPTALDLTVASGVVPAETAKVEIHLFTPAKTTLEVQRVSLRYPKTTTVPVKFIAEAPGDLTVSDVRIAFEEVPPQAPAIPIGGMLCQSTPPGREPGKGGDSCFCYQCEAETNMIEMKSVLTPEGRPATSARCPVCKTELLNIGGSPGANAQALPLRQTMPSGPVVVRTAFTKSTGSSFVAPQSMQLTDILGIGEPRARQLVDIGIDSVEKLATSTPEAVVKIRFITLAMASKIIAQAKSHLGGS
jgi:DNA-binding beta-propeller fold protein YncE